MFSVMKKNQHNAMLLEYKQKIPESSKKDSVSDFQKNKIKKVPKGAVSLLNGNTHKDAL